MAATWSTAQELYDKACYEAQMRTLPPELRHRGGVFLEAATWSAWFWKMN
jgi:hypothetical protein